MAGISSPGLGSGLDINSLVTQLVAAERKPVGDAIARDSKRIDSQISALGTLKGGLSSLQTALSSLKSEASFQARTAKSSKPEVFTASASSQAASGTYSIEVVNLATAHKLNSTPFGSSAAVGTGTLTITSGTDSFDVVIEAGANTLAGIRDAINDHADNDSVSATIVNTNQGARLVLAARNTGVEHAISISAAGGDGGLDALVYDPDPGGVHNMEQLVEARNALVRVEGFERTSANNSISDAIDGVTLSLVSAKEGETHTLTVANDPDKTKERVKSFVTAFNALAVAMASLRAYNPDTRIGGALLGDALLRNVESELRRGVSDGVAGASEGMQSLSMAGITTNQDGTLKLDESKLGKALDANFDAIGKLFGGENGIGTRLDGIVTKHLDDDASLVKRAEALQRSKREITTRTDALDARMKVVQQRYMKQFTALDTLLTKMQSTSSYLAQQLSR